MGMVVGGLSVLEEGEEDVMKNYVKCLYKK